MCFLILQPYVYMKHIYICSHEAHTFVYLFPLSLCLFFIFLSLLPRLPRWLSGKEPTCSAIVYHWIKIPRFHPWVREIPWRTEWQPTPVFLTSYLPSSNFFHFFWILQTSKEDMIEICPKELLKVMERRENVPELLILSGTGNVLAIL